MKDKQRYWVTLGAILVYLLLSCIPLYRYPKDLFYDSNPFIGLFALGIMPIGGGFLTIEIFSFFLAPFYRWKKEGIEGRKKINRAQLVCTLIFTVAQSLSTVLQHSSMLTINLFGFTGSLPQILLVISLCLGVFIIYYLAITVNRYGVVNGFILLFFWDALIGKADDFWRAIRTDIKLYKYYDLPSNPFYLQTFDQRMNAFYLLLAMIGLGYVCYKKWNVIIGVFKKYPVKGPTLIFKSDQSQYAVSGSPIPQTISGGLLALPLFLQLIWGKGLTSPENGNLYRYIWDGAEIVDGMITALLLWLLFSSRRWVNHQLERRAIWVDGRIEMKKHFVFWYILVFSTYTLKKLLWFQFTCHTFDQAVQTLLSPLLFLEVYILGLEIFEKIAFDLKMPKSICMAEMDNVAMVQLWVAQLKEENIHFHIEGLRYRQLTQFFVPYLKMRLFVEKRDVERAANIIQIETVKQI